MVLDTTITSATITTTGTKDIEGDNLGGFGLDTLLPLIWTGSGTIGVTGGSAFIIEPTGEFWDQANGTITADVGGVQSTGYIINEGNFLKEDGTGTTLIGTGMNFINDFNAPGDGLAPEDALLYQLAAPPGSPTRYSDRDP